MLYLSPCHRTLTVYAPLPLGGGGGAGIGGGSWPGGRKINFGWLMFQAFLLEEMNQWVGGMEGNAFFPKVLTLVVTCRLRFVKKRLLGQFIDYLSQ